MGLRKTLLKSRIKKFRNRALSAYEKIINDYDLRLSINDDIFQLAANDYGFVMAQRGFLGWLTNAIATGKLILFILALAMSIYNPFSLHLAFVIATSVLTISAFIVTSAVEGITISKTLGSLKEQNKSYALSLFNDAKDERAKNSDILSTSLIYAPYEIYANGSIYKHGQAGFETGFNANIAPDVNKGILGQGIKKDEVLEFNANRSQVKDGGNINFIDESLKNPFPNARATNTKEHQEIITECFYARALKTTQGFAKLIDAGFGIGVQDESFISSSYEKVKNATLKPFMSNLCELDFLYKNKAYQRGEMKATSYLSLRDFDTPKFIKDESEQVDLELYQRVKEIIENEKMPNDEKVLFYSSMLQMCFEAVFFGEVYHLVRDNGKNDRLNPFALSNSYNTYEQTSLMPIYAFLDENNKNKGFFGTHPKKDTDNMDKTSFINAYPNYKAFKNVVEGFFVKQNAHTKIVKIDMPHKAFSYAYGDHHGRYIKIYREQARIDLSLKEDAFVFHQKEYVKVFNGYKWINYELISILKDKTLIKLFDDFAKFGFLEFPKSDDKNYALIQALLEKEYEEYLKALFDEA